MRKYIACVYQCVGILTCLIHSASMEYGLGYVWNPDEITITVGDSILWNWYGTSFTRQLSVQQVDKPGDTEYNGDGFLSDGSTRGSFTHTFTITGDYYFIAGGYGHIGVYIHD